MDTRVWILTKVVNNEKILAKLNGDTTINAKALSETKIDKVMIRINNNWVLSYILATIIN